MVWKRSFYICGLVYSWVAGKFLLLPDIWNESAENNWLLLGYVCFNEKCVFCCLIFCFNGSLDCSTWKQGKKVIAISAYVVYFLEIYLIRDCKSADDKSMFLSFLVLIPLLFIVVIDSNLTTTKAKVLRSYSTGIYFMHKAVIHIWLIVFAVIRVEILPTVEFAFVLLSCFIACTIAYKIDNKLINMLTR